MRELKFRIWDGNNKYFVYPDILELDRGLEYQQFTGLLDKQGKEIYESDRVSDGKNPEFIVTWDFALLSRLNEITDILVVTGNIYENYELIGLTKFDDWIFGLEENDGNTKKP